MNGYDPMTIVLETDGYSIGLVNETQYDPASTDHVRRYDRTYADEAGDTYRSSSRHGIFVYSGGEALASCCVCSSGGATGIHATCCVFDDGYLLLCCGDSIFCLTIPALDLSWWTKADMVTCFEIFTHEGGYIVHGELELSRLSRDGAIVWQFSGPDIFVTQAGVGDFVLDGDVIHAAVWTGQRFTIDAKTGKEV